MRVLNRQMENEMFLFWLIFGLFLKGFYLPLRNS